MKNKENNLENSFDAASEHWTGIAKIWEQIGPPLRPSPEDIAFVQEEVHDWSKIHGAPRALILGVTPELYHMAWPQGTDILAADHTQSMIDSVWPGPRNAVICSEWTELPLENGSRDIVLCDGGIHLMYPQDHQSFVRTLTRILPSGGLCIFRLFVPPEKKETPGDVLQDLLEARIANLNLLKLRLSMALQENSAEGVSLNHIWNLIHEAAPDFERLALRIGWNKEHLRAIHTYQNSRNRYYFLRVQEVQNLFCDNPGGFEVKEIHTPAYALGERCPTLVLKRTKDGAI
jgi:SAM-dependent methyltransferase